MPPREPDRQQELGWDLFMRRGWRYAAVATPALVGFAIYAGVTDGAGAAVFIGTGAAVTAAIGFLDWRNGS